MLRQAKEVACDGDVYLDGGDIVQQAIAADLVDEFILTLVPALLGEGVRLWGAHGGAHSRKIARRKNPRCHHGFLRPILHRHVVRCRVPRC
ncbi:MAG: dihydrofolate reductase family protein [Myxococcota bacterium]